MRPFVVNGHGRLVFPSNFSADLDFSVLETLDQLAAVIRRDFEAKAPTGTEILERVDSDGYRSRYALLRDIAMNLVWGNRYAMTMYEKRPTRWRDLPRHRDDVFLPLLTPWDEGERKIAAVGEAWAALPPTWDARGRGPDLHDPVRHLPPQAPSRDRASAGEADRGGDRERSGEPHVLLPDARSRPPDLQLPGDPRLHGGGARARAAPPARDGPPQPVSVGPGRTRLEEVGRIGDDEFVVAFVPRSHEVLEFIRRVRAGRPRARGRWRPPRRRRPVEPFAPVVVREQFAYAAPRGAGGRQGRGRLHERGPDPQRGLQLVADDGGRDPGEDRDRGAPLHGSPPRAHLPAGGPGGARGRRAPAGGDRRRSSSARVRARG